MPELPEVETTRLGLYNHMMHQTIEDVVIRVDKLRWPIDKDALFNLKGKKIKSIQRRAKYLIFGIGDEYLIIHLGMSGHLQVLKNKTSPKKHDHIDIILTNKTCIRYNDPRKFGSFLWTKTLDTILLLSKLGPEPLEETFNTAYLKNQLKNRKASIKSVIMNQQVVVGVGNIYASEALFLANIHPLTHGNQLTRTDCEKLTLAIKQILTEAIQKGGTTLQDYVNSDGKPGYFSQQLNVYQRENKPCVTCKAAIEQLKIGQRSSFFCPKCQHRKK